METRRVILIVALLFVSFMLWNAWQAENAPLVTAMPTTTAATTTITMPAQTEKALSVGKNLKDRYIQIHTKVFDATIDKVGGNLVDVKLLDYPVTVKNPKQPINLLNNNPDTFYVAKSGIVNQSLIYQSAKNSYTVTPDQSTLTVLLTAKTASGVAVTKTYVFDANQYLVHVNEEINNATGKTWQGQLFNELDRKQVAAHNGGPFHFASFLGAVFSTPQKRYQQLSFEKMHEQDLSTNTQNGWVAMVQHYFLSAWVPNPSSSYHYYTKKLPNDIYSIGFVSPTISVAPGKQTTVNNKLYVGPEIAKNLKAVAPGLDLTIDYGLLWFIAVVLFAIMQKIHMVVGNWGWSIVLVTLLIKIVFYKLNSISFQSMANMRELQPKMQQLRERYGDDKQKMTQATMELYRKEKINPMGGCLPMIVQIPVFLSLYWVLVESVQLRQAPFIFWIHDLSTKDPFYVLPVLMGLTIFIQQRLAPKTPDPMQQKVMMVLPFIFTILFLSFPAGLVLYWVVNNSLSILQQWYINKHVVPKARAKKAEKTAKKR